MASYRTAVQVLGEGSLLKCGKEQDVLSRGGICGLDLFLCLLFNRHLSVEPGSTTSSLISQQLLHPERLEEGRTSTPHQTSVRRCVWGGQGARVRSLRLRVRLTTSREPRSELSW